MVNAFAAKAFAAAEVTAKFPFIVNGAVAVNAPEVTFNTLNVIVPGPVLLKEIAFVVKVVVPAV